MSTKQSQSQQQSQSQSLYEVYADLHRTHSAQFGPKTTIFLQVGSFYELYDIQDPDTGKTALNIKDMTDNLGLQMAIHKGAAPGDKDGLVAGFPDYTLHRWAGRLTSIGWTVVVVDQVKTSTGKVQKRVLSRVLSPSTHIENMSAMETPYLTTLYFCATSTVQAPTFGIASLDLTTGLTVSYSDSATGRPDFWTADTLVQNLAIFQPKEVLIYWHSTTSSLPPNIRTILGLSESTTIHLRPIDDVGAFSKPLANAEYLCKAYSIKSLLPPREYLGIRSIAEELALLYLIQFIEEHMPSIGHRLAQNESWVPNLQLVCGNHALSQLQIISSHPGDHSVSSLFSGAITPMGKRGLHQRLVRPLTSASHIEDRLSEIDAVLGWTSELRTEIQKQLRFCFDLPRLHRKIQMGTLLLTEYAPLYQTYSAIQSIGRLISAPLTATYSQGIWDSFNILFQKHIDSKKAFSATSDITPFSSDTYSQIATTEANIQVCISSMNAVCQRLSIAAGLNADALRLEPREKGEAFGIRASSSQIKALQKYTPTLPHGTHISALKSGGWVETPELISLNHTLFSQREQLSRDAQSIHLEVCIALSVAGEKVWSALEQWISHIDVTQAIAYTCQAKGFHRPTIIAGASTSYVHLEGLRHPLVEASSTSRVSYVQHTVSLGKTDDCGYLIYGMNASGKSTLMKATGVAVLLAQAGCYVPATKMELAPFRAIYTRILNHDNLFAGLSSFAVEMSELRDILSSADHQTLVLGDELCAGTESVSAEALVAAGIQWLSNCNAKFMFATHLHRLSDLLQDDAVRLGLKIFHLHVEYDPVSKKLIYDRSLRPGSGTSLYGLEVARAMDLPLDFIEQAQKNRRALLNTRAQSGAPTSSWNSAIVRRSCEMCDSAIISELEVHHIEPRILANAAGLLPNGKPMNAIANLIVLCDKCHDKHHAGNLPIQPLVQTSDGPARLGTSEEPTTVRSKWSEEDMKQIRKMLMQFKTMSLKVIQFQLKQNGIEISAQTLGKMRKEL